VRGPAADFDLKILLAKAEDSLPVFVFDNGVDLDDLKM
jgi:hypothetical protein